MKLRKLGLAALALTFGACLASCGGGNSETKTSTPDATESTSAESTPTASESTPEETTYVVTLTIKLAKELADGNVLKVSYNQDGVKDGDWTEVFSDTNKDVFTVDGTTYTLKMNVTKGVTALAIYIGEFKADHNWVQDLFASDVYDVEADNTVTVEAEKPIEFGDVLSYDEFEAADANTLVTIQGTVMAKYAYSSWGNTTLYLADDDGAYFVYRLAMTEDEYNTIAVGDVLKVLGSKSVWKGETEVDCQGGSVKWEKVTDATPSEEITTNLTKNFDDAEAIAAYNNQKVEYDLLEVVSVTEPSAEGGDIYYDVTNGKTTYTFCVESDLCGKDTDVYKAVLALKAGDLINVTGYQYIYEKPQLHTMSVEVVSVMTYEEFQAAEVEASVTIGGYVSKKFVYTKWNNFNMYLEDENGKGYYVYRLAGTQEQYDAIEEGDYIIIKAAKAAWKGEVEVDCQGGSVAYKVLADDAVKPYSQCIYPLGNDLTSDQLASYNNQSVKLTAVVKSVTAPSADGGDIYYTVTYNGTDYTFCVESDLTPADTDVYKTVLGLVPYTTVELEGYMYIYEKPQLHTVKCTVGDAADVVLVTGQTSTYTFDWTKISTSALTPNGSYYTEEAMTNVAAAYYDNVTMTDNALTTAFGTSMVTPLSGCTYRDGVSAKTNSWYYLKSGKATIGGNNPKCIEVKDDGISITIQNPTVITLGVASTGSANASLIGIKDESGKFVTPSTAEQGATLVKTGDEIKAKTSDATGTAATEDIAGSYYISGTSAFEFEYTFTTPGIYKISSPAAITGRGARILSCEIEETQQIKTTTVGAIVYNPTVVTGRGVAYSVKLAKSEGYEAGESVTLLKADGTTMTSTVIAVSTTGGVLQVLLRGVESTDNIIAIL